MLSKSIQNFLLSFAMAASVFAWLDQAHVRIVNYELLNIPIFFIVLMALSFVIAEDVRNSFKKVLRFEQRQDKRSLWQVGIGMIFFITQIGFVELFARQLMPFNLGGMPLYIVFSFMNAFLLTVIYEEIFYKEEKIDPFRFKKLK